MKLILTFSILLSLISLRAFSDVVCYPGEKLDNKTCLNLVSAKDLKYINPFTDKSFPTNLNKNQYRPPVRVIDLNLYSGDLKILPNFFLKDFMSSLKGRYGLFSRQVSGILQEMRASLNKPIRINSAFRSPEHNANVGGSAKWSRHQFGDAFDLSSTTATLNQLVDICKKFGANYIDKYRSHVHCDWRAIELEESFFGPKIKSNDVAFSSEALIEEKQNTAFILVDGNLRMNGYVRLSSSDYEKEDAEELYKKWVIVTPKGRWLEFEQDELTLSLDEKGTYYIYHYIGAHVRLDKVIEIR